jgi:transposase
MGNEGSAGKRHTTEELRELVRSVRDGTFHYDGRPKKSRDWSTYDELQVREVSSMLELIRKFVDAASGRVQLQERGRKGGRPPVYPPSDVAKALLLQSYFGVSNRVAAGLVELFKEKLGISQAFSYKTIERGYDPSPVTLILQEVFRLTNELGNAKEDTFSFDGSGDPTSGKVNYESVRSEQRRRSEGPVDWQEGSRHDFQYGLSSVGVHTRLIDGFKSTAGYSVGELSMFPSVLSQTYRNCPGMKTALGDALYSTRSACALVAQYGVKPYFFPKQDSTFRSHGVPAWKEMTYGLVQDPQGWLQTYHMRSISESVNSVDKRRFPWKLKKKLAWRKETESLLRRDVYNVRQYSYLSYLQPDMVVMKITR